MIKGKTRIYFYAQDEGSVKALRPVFSSCQQWPGASVAFFALGQALAFMKRQSMPCEEFAGFPSKEDEESLPDLLITGASMRESIEKKAITHARARGIPSLTILDTGSKFWERFTVSGDRDLSTLPDRILAPDEESRDRMYTLGFPKERVVATGNPHYDTIRPLASRKSETDKPVLLVVMQPVYSDKRYESDLGWLSIIRTLRDEFRDRLSVIVRPHPKEKSDLYRVLGDSGVRVERDGDIADLIARSAMVIGKNSTSLIEAVLMGKTVASLDLTDGRFEPLPTERMGLSRRLESLDELVAFLKKSLVSESTIPKLKRVRYYNDGRNTERTLAVVRDMLQRAQTESRHHGDHHG